MAMKHILPTLLTIAIPALLGSCSTEEDDPTRTTHSATIMPTATINMDQASSRANGLRGPVPGNKFPVNTNNVFAVTAYKSKVDETNDYGDFHFYNQPVNSTAISGEMTFQTSQYYPTKGELYFYAYSPVMKEASGGKGYMHSISTAPTVTFDISRGQTDILWARTGDGIAKATAGASQRHPNFLFEHKLQKLQFKFVKDKNFKANCKVTRICVSGAPTSKSDENNRLYRTATLNLITGDVTYKGDNAEHKLENLSYDIKDAEDAEETDKCILTRPIKSIKLTIVYKTGSEGTKNIKTFTSNVTLNRVQTDEGGKNYLLTVKFSPKSEPGVTVTEKNDGWEDESLTEQKIDYSYYVLD